MHNLQIECPRAAKCSQHQIGRVLPVPQPARAHSPKQAHQATAKVADFGQQEVSFWKRRGREYDHVARRRGTAGNPIAENARRQAEDHGPAVDAYCGSDAGGIQ
jgi:hypothetical protein